MLNVQLFGKLRLVSRGMPVDTLHSTKAQELLAYLILYRHRVHARETLAGVLWGDCPTAQSRKYLRQALWQLQGVLAADDTNSIGVGVEADGLQVRALPGFCDVVAFDEVAAAVRPMPAEAIDADCAQRLQRVLDLYRGDLLEGWYQEWCLYERERLQNLYLSMLGKLMGYHEARGDYEAAIDQGGLILRIDPARESAHQHLMRLYLLAGDHGRALQQYRRCTAVLQDELGVHPSKQTMELYHEIRQGGAGEPLAAIPPGNTDTAAPEALRRLRGVLERLGQMQEQVRQEISALECALATSKARLR